MYFSVLKSRTTTQPPDTIPTIALTLPRVVQTTPDLSFLTATTTTTEPTTTESFGSTEAAFMILEDIATVVPNSMMRRRKATRKKRKKRSSEGYFINYQGEIIIICR